MQDSKSTKPARKPQPSFPLWQKSDGRWCKKVRGKFHYFGKVSDDPTGDSALALWMAQKDDLLAGRTPRPAFAANGLTVWEMTQRFLTFKEQALVANEIGARTFDEYKETAKLICGQFGDGRLVDDLATVDFQNLRAAMAKRWGPVRLGNEIQRVRTIFRFADDAGLLVHPVRFGPSFKKPSAKVIRLARAETGSREFSAADLRSLLDSAGPNMRAMILLGINGGLGNTDLALLKSKSLDLDSGWLNYPRPKTGVQRRVPLWPETIKAIAAALEARPEPKDKVNSAFVFISPRGLPYSAKNRTYGLTAEFIRLTKRAALADRTFYDLRRTFQTIAEGCNDLVAVQSIMGHAAKSGDMSAVYRQRVDDTRLRAAVNVVRDWLAWTYPQSATDGEKKTLKSAG